MKSLFRMILSVIVFAAAPSVDASAKDRITVTAVGDIIMGTTYPGDILPPNDGMEIFDRVKHFVKQGDIVFGNLEGPLIDGGIPSKCGKMRGVAHQCFEFRTPTRYSRHLRDAGFNVLNIANNHSIDFGVEGLESTISALASEKIQASGGSRIASFHVRGKKIAVIGFSFITGSPYSYSILDIARAKHLIGQLKGRNDLVIVSFHGGAEGKEALEMLDVDEVYHGEKRGNPIRFSQAVIDSGADLVLGHGPHVLRTLEVYRGKLVAYSLGNFVAYGMMNTKGPSGQSIILTLKLDSETGDFVGGNIISIDLVNRGIPSVDSGNKALNLIKRLTEKSRKEQRPVIEESGEFRSPHNYSERQKKGVIARNGVTKQSNKRKYSLDW